MAWSGRNWDDIPASTWDNITLYIHEDGTFGVEFDYTGFNYRTYHYPETEVDFDDWLYIYDELKSFDMEFEVEYG